MPNLYVLGAAALAAMSIATPAGAAPRAEHLKLKISSVTSPIFLFDAGIAEQNLVPAIQVTGLLSGCTSGADNYGESTTVEQDGHTLFEWGGHPGSGLVSCTDPSGSTVNTDPIFAFSGAPVHPGRVRITMTVQSYSSSAKVTVTRWATIPG
ncbi:hypothetical protein [Jatrophihabitans sp.]|uniref:hypothetical protein n=1 Tax=Jatrophihabitans sp. TaxID=1932789 RepID=UPI002B8F8F76|nr:hypothetical protein [Jatrophihabitans sp.]